MAGPTLYSVRHRHTGLKAPGIIKALPRLGAIAVMRVFGGLDQLGARSRPNTSRPRSAPAWSTRKQDIGETVGRSKIRARVEHPFHIVKDLFRHRKVRYKGLAKNTAQMHTLFALANLVIAKRALLA